MTGGHVTTSGDTTSTRALDAASGFLLVVNILLGAVGGLALLLSITFGAGGFGGDGTMSGAERAAATRGRVAASLACVTAVAAITGFVALRHRPSARALVLLGLGVVGLGAASGAVAWT